MTREEEPNKSEKVYEVHYQVEHPDGPPHEQRRVIVIARNLLSMEEKLQRKRLDYNAPVKIRIVGYTDLGKPLW